MKKWLQVEPNKEISFTMPNWVEIIFYCIYHLNRWRTGRKLNFYEVYLGLPDFIKRKIKVKHYKTKLISRGYRFTKIVIDEYTDFKS